MDIQSSVCALMRAKGAIAIIACAFEPMIYVDMHINDIHTKPHFVVKIMEPHNYIQDRIYTLDIIHSHHAIADIYNFATEHEHWHIVAKN
jgi:hypothetical protein